MEKKLAKVNQSVEKALQLVEVLASSREPMRLGDLAAACGLPASTTLRLVNTLLLLGYANQDPVTLRYSLTLKFAQIGSQVSSQMDIRNLAHPWLLELSSRCGESCCLAIEENRPLYCTGVGKIFLLNDDAASLEQYIAENGLEPLTSHTITTREGLLSELEKIGRQGYALDDEECEQGARCVAAGVRDYTGKVVAGISVSGPLHRMEPEHIRRIIPQVQRTAQRLSQLLAYEE